MPDNQNPRPLEGRRIVAPPSRPLVHPLRLMLQRAGAFVWETPQLRVSQADPGPLQDAALRIHELDWVLVAGEPSAKALLHHLGSKPQTVRVAVVGAGAHGALRTAGWTIDASPVRHTADAVAHALGPLHDKRVLLVRVQGASQELPEALLQAGARIEQVDGYRMDPLFHEQDLIRLREPWDALAFANPTAVRFFVRSIAPLEPDPARLCSMPVAVPGEGTAREARRAGFSPTIVGSGRLASLVAQLVASHAKA